MKLLHPQSPIRDVPQISRDKFDRFLRATTEFTLCVLDKYGLRDPWSARPTLTPLIRFLYIGSRICSTLPSNPASRRRPCASLSFLLYQDGKRTYTSKLSTLLGVPKKGGPIRRAAVFVGYAKRYDLDQPSSAHALISRRAQVLNGSTTIATKRRRLDRPFTISKGVRPLQQEEPGLSRMLPRKVRESVTTPPG